MSFIRIGLLVDDEVFHVMGFEEDNPIAEKWIAAFRSQVQLIDINGYAKIRKGYLYDGENFYGPEDVSFSSPVEKGTYDISESIQFAGVMDGEVMGFMTFVREEMEEGFYEMVIAAMSSNPTYQELPENVNVGWKFINNTFVEG